MRIRNIIVPVVASVALLAGCTTQTPSSAPTTAAPTPEYNGVQDLEAEAIVQAAVDALGDAQSFRLKGEGKTDEGQSFAIDAVFAGDLAEGTLAFDGLEVEFVIVDGDAYVRGTEEFYRANLSPEEADVLIPLLGDRYLKLPAADVEDLLIRPEDILEENPQSITKGEITEYQGQPAITVTDSEGENLYVALVGEPYPLAVVAPEGTLEFLDIDANVIIEAPPADDVFDVSAFTG